MTRINLVEPSVLVRQHLIAEFRELPRIFSLVRDAEARGLTPHRWAIDAPPAYTLGAGHCTFFYGRLAFLAKRYTALATEMQVRAYKPAFLRPPAWIKGLDAEWFLDYEPTPEAVLINKRRINQRLVEMGLTQHQLSLD